MYIRTVHPKKLKKNSHMNNTYYYPSNWEKKNPGMYILRTIHPSLINLSIMLDIFLRNIVQMQPLTTHAHSPLRTHTCTLYPLWVPLRDWADIFWDWQSHHECLAVDGYVVYHWKNLSSLGLEHEWAISTTRNLTSWAMFNLK
jgi:hypothetical protein